MKHIDFHAHILPGADHGSDSLETSLKQIELSKSANIDIILATPHFYPHKHSLNSFLKRRNEAYKALKNATDIKIIPAAEVLLCDNLDKMEGLSELCIQNTDSILLELPFSDFRYEYIECVDSLINKGYNIILAHADRYPEENINKLLNIGAKIQLNVSSLSKISVKRHIYEWIEHGFVVALGSDIHMTDKKAYKKFLKAKKRLGDDYERIMSKSLAIMENKI